MPGTPPNVVPVELIQNALARVPAGLLIAGSDGNVIYAAGKLFATIKVEVASCVGRSLAEVFDNDLAAMNLIRTGQQYGESFSRFEWHERLVEGRIALFKGSEQHTVLYLVDVTERAGAEEDLVDSEERARLLSESALEGLVLHDQGNILDVNPTFAEMLGYARIELLGRNAFDFVTLEDREKVSLSVMQESPYPHEALAIRKDGTFIPVEIRGKSISYRGNRVRVAVIRDITQRKQAEAALSESEKRYRDLFENANDVIYTHDLAGRFTSLNHAAEQLVGMSQAEAVGSRVFDIIAPEHLALTREMTRRKLSGEPTPAYEVDIIGKHGKRVTVETNTRLIFRDGVPVGLQGIGRDVTERKAMETELRHRIQFEELVTTISTNFISFAPEELDAGIQGALQKIGEFVGVDRIYIFRFNEEGMFKWYEWCAPGVAPQPDVLQAVAVQNFPWFSERFRRREIIHIPRVSAMPAEAHIEKGLFLSQSVQTLLAVPMVSGRSLVGFLGLDSVDEEKEWTEHNITLVKVISEAFVNALERKRTEEALRESEERYKLAALGANDGLWDWNLRTNEVFYSTRWKAMLGHRENEIGVSPEEWFQRIHPDDAERVQNEIRDHLNNDLPFLETEHRMRHADGTYRWMLLRGIAVRDIDGAASRAAGSQTDVTVRKAAEERLYFDAFHDSLTGLPNRALFIDRLDRVIRRTARSEEATFAVLFLDLDRFKVINDGLGHSVGDQLLISIGRRLEACLRPGDTIARLGGDEFTVLLDDAGSLNDATRVAERIQYELTRPFKLDDHEVFTSASIGIAMGTKSHEHPEELLRDADTAMYRAKALGKARYAVFDSPMHQRAMEQLNMETELRRSLERDDFKLMYQPIINLTTGQIAGFEALLRWHHPKRGLVSPPMFIPLAEETGLIIPIGKWVFTEACRQLKIWHEKFPFPKPLTMAINLSAKQFIQNSLLPHIQAVLDETGVDPRTLRLEITESILMENAKIALGIVGQLKVMNINLHLDDFGTGYSSLSYLHRFPIDTLKIDRSFISRMAFGDEIEIVRTISALARHLGKSVIAEGVETQEQLAQLRTLECQQAQGYLFAKPLDVEQAEDFLRRNPTW